MRLRNFRRQKLFEPISFDKPKSYFKLPSGDLFLTIVIVISYLLTRVTYENHSKSKIGNEIFTLINKTGLKIKLPNDARLFRMNSHSKRANKKISDIVFLSLLAFFSFKVNWNNMGSSTNVDRIAWVVSVLVAPIIINIFIENKNKHKIKYGVVSSVKQLKESNNQTKVFLSIALLLTLAVCLKLVHRIFVCKGGMTKPILIQIIIIGTTVGLYFLANKDKKENFGSSTEDSLGEYFEELFTYKVNEMKHQWKEKDVFMKKLKKEDFKTTDQIIQDYEISRLNKFKIDLEKRRKKVNEIFKTKESADNYINSNKSRSNEKRAYEVINLEAEADWPKLWKASEWMYKRIEEWFEQGYWEKYEKEGRPYPGTVIRLYKKLLMNNDGSMIKLSKDTVPSEDVRKKWIFIVVMGGLFYYLDGDIILNSTEFNTYDKIKGNFKYLFYYNKIFQAYHDTINDLHPRKFLIKKFEPSQSVDNVFNFYKNKIKRELPIVIYMSLYDKVPFTQKVVLEAYARKGIFKTNNYSGKFNRYKDLIDKVKLEFHNFLTKYPTEPTLEDVKKHEKVKYTYYCSPYEYSEKDKFIKFYMKPENKSLNETIAVSKDNKSVIQYSWVISFLLILSFTVCKKDTIDYIIEGSLWGYLIQNIARWEDISPNLM